MTQNAKPARAIPGKSPAQHALMKALVRMMKDTSLDKVTITALCQHARVNRSTFYLYYKDLGDLYASIQQFFMGQVNDILRGSRGSIPSVEDFTKIYQLVYRYQDACRVLFSAGNGHNLLVHLAGGQHLTSLCKGQAPTIAPDTLAYVHAFVTGTHIMLVGAWLRGGCKESPRQMALLANRLMLHGFAGLPQQQDG